MFRGKAASIAVFLWVAAAQCHSQAFALTSSDKHVVLRKGTLLTLRTIADPAHADGQTVVPPDHVLETVLNHKISGKNTRYGDAVRLSLVYPVVFEAEGKQVRIPENAAITGHVVYAAPRDDEHSVSKLVIVADTIHYGDREARLPAVVTSAQVHVRKTVRPPADDHDRSFHPTNSQAVLGRSRRGPAK